MKLAFAITLTCFVLLSGCSENTRESVDTSISPQAAAKPSASSESGANITSPLPAKVATSDSVFAVPEGTNPVYRIISGEPAQEGNARYLRARIVVPAGLDRATLEANIRHAAKTLYDKHHPTGMFIFANKQGTDLNGEYTAGRCDFHPISKDKHDSTITLEDCEAKIDLVDDYFQGSVSEPKSTGDAELDQSLGVDRTVWKATHKKFGEPQRRSIYYDIIVAGKRASDKAEQKYPDNYEAGQKVALEQIGKRNQMEEDLTTVYEKVVAKKHHLTFREVQSIKSEGLQAHWPMPED